MRMIWCDCCGAPKPHDYIGREHDFDEDGPGIRAFAAITTLGMSEIFGTKRRFYQCKQCGSIVSKKA